LGQDLTSQAGYHPARADEGIVAVRFATKPANVATDVTVDAALAVAAVQG
jgi:hypothetical protein